MASQKYDIECGLVASLLLQSDYSKGVAVLVSEQLSTYLGRMEAAAVAARKDGRTASFGKADKDANAVLKFLAMKVAKADVSYLPCRLLVIADAQAAFCKATGIEADSVSFELPESVRGLLSGMEQAGKAKAAAMESERLANLAKADSLIARQKLAASLLAEHDKQEEAKKVKAAQAVTA